MIIKRIEREISHKINLGNFESIQPTIRIVADLEEGDDPAEAKKMLDKAVEEEWIRTALKELRQVVERRRGIEIKDDKSLAQMNGLKRNLAEIKA